MMGKGLKMDKGRYTKTKTNTDGYNISTNTRLKEGKEAW